MKERIITEPNMEDCPACGGDGVSTCNNPDHGFINAVGGELARLGCPCCGHSEDHKIKGEKCEMCLGVGKIMVAG